MASGSSSRNIPESNFSFHHNLYDQKLQETFNGNPSEHPIGSDSVKAINNEGSLLHFIEGLSLRLSQMEFYFNNLDKFINKIHSDFKHSHEEQVSKLKSLEKLVQEVLIHIQKTQKERTIPEHPAQSMHTRYCYSPRSPVTVKNPPTPSTDQYKIGFNLSLSPHQHDQQWPQQPNNMNQSLSPCNRPQVYGELIARLMTMGYMVDHAGIAIKTLEGRGQSIDIQALQDWLNCHPLYKGKE